MNFCVFFFFCCKGHLHSKSCICYFVSNDKTKEKKGLKKRMLQYHCNMIKYKISIRFQITFHNILFLKYISHLHHTKMIHVHSAHIPAGLYLTSKQSSIVNISQRHLQCSSSLRSLQYNMVAIITFICHHIRKNIGNIKCSVHVMEIQT